MPPPRPPVEWRRAGTDIDVKRSKARLFLALAALLLAALPVSPAAAADRGVLGYGRIFDNDVIGDGHDRWRTGSYSLSQIRGASWDGTPPPRFGALMEYRLHTEILTPASLTAPAATDRRYAGILSFGAHTHFAVGKAEASVGADLVVVGPQTGIGGFQRSVHKLLGLSQPAVLGNQIGDAVYPTLVAELGRNYHLGGAVTLRPFVAAEAGAETLVRVGGDMVIGDFGRGDMMLRDGSTGQRYRAVRANEGTGLSLILGGDIAHVADSHYLPAGGSAPLEPTRSRLRAGMNWQGKTTALFYGVTWMGKEFTSQPDTQLVGSLRISLKF